MGTYKKRYVIILVMAVVAVGVSFFIFASKHASVDSEFTDDAVVAAPAAKGKGKTAGEAVVYITGAINQPGLYTLQGQLRVTELITLAGGLAPDADVSKVNLARIVKDGIHIHIPLIKAKKMSSAAAGTRQGRPRQTAPAVLLPVNINTASAEELADIKGISFQLAVNIAEYRAAHGAFAAGEDLLKVPGFSKRHLNNIKDQISW